MPALPLVPLDSLQILSIVDNEVDPISPAPPVVKAVGRLGETGLRLGEEVEGRGEGVKEIKMSQVCCGAHGLSLMITVTASSTTSTLLFDTGPEDRAFELNATRLRAPLHTISRIHLSHWHRDHSGGMLAAIRLINAAKATQASSFPSSTSSDPKPLVVDLHPSRPIYRGVQTPLGPLSLEADPTFAEIEEAGAKVEMHGEAHVVAGGWFGVSGGIERGFEGERGMKGGIRWVEDEGKSGRGKGEWVKDELIEDERLVVCWVRDKGLVVFTGCSHAGTVNVARHAFELGGGIPLYAIVGGYHLADAEPAQIQATVKEFKKLGVKVLMAGHCTGWRAKFEIEKEMPGCLVPSFVGMMTTL